MPTFSFLYAPTCFTADLPRYTECSPTYLYFLRYHGFGAVLHARSLSIPNRSTSELLRTL